MRRTEYQLSVSVHLYQFLFENGDFFPLVWPNRPQVFGESDQLKRIFSKTLSSQSGDFENAGHSFLHFSLNEVVNSGTNEVFTAFAPDVLVVCSFLHHHLPRTNMTYI